MNPVLRPISIAAFVALAGMIPARAAQDPVDKPRTDPTTLDRLPAPTSVTARQLPDGRIEVRWNAVEGAARYDVWRSVPPAPQMMVSRPNPADTTYIDTDVKAGSTYYYVIGAVARGGTTTGLRAGSRPVTATTVATGLRVSDPGTGPVEVIPTDPTASGGTQVPQTCQPSGGYSTCTSELIQYSPLLEPVKSVSILCPQAGQIATGGGFGGNLNQMSVVMSAPVIASAKTRAGWTVALTPVLIPGMDPVAALTQTLGSVTRSFRVFVVCAPDGSAP